MSVRTETALNISVDSEEDPSTISVDGELDSFSAGSLREAFTRTLGDAHVIIDIRQVPFMDSAGLGALIGGIRRLREGGAGVAICCTATSVLRLLEMTGFDRMVPITRTPAEAMEVITETELARSGA